MAETSEPTKSRVNLTAEFHTTADTPFTFTAQTLAAALALYAAVEFDLADVTVKVQSGVVFNRERYERERAEYEAAQDPSFGNPAKDGLN